MKGHRVREPFRAGASVFAGEFAVATRKNSFRWHHLCRARSARNPLATTPAAAITFLPTGGWARRRGGLSANEFVKQISVQSIRPAGYRRLADDVQILARAEGLLAHANAVEVRK